MVDRLRRTGSITGLKYGEPHPVDPERDRLHTKFLDILRRKTGADKLTAEEKAKLGNRSGGPGFTIRLIVPAGIGDLKLGYLYGEGNNFFAVSGSFHIYTLKDGEVDDHKLRIASLQRPRETAEFSIGSYNPNHRRSLSGQYFPALEDHQVTREDIEEVMEVMQNSDPVKVQRLLVQFHHPSHMIISGIA